MVLDFYKMQTASRKRTRSDDDCFSVRKKMFVNQRIINNQNEEKMKEIHSRTINMLFKAAKNFHGEKLPAIQGELGNVRLFGNGIVDFVNGKKIKDATTARLPSKCCNKLALVRYDCSNCSLGVCEFCGYTCLECGAFLCSCCVSIFDCAGEDGPCCSQCKFYSIK